MQERWGGRQVDMGRWETVWGPTERRKGPGHRDCNFLARPPSLLTVGPREDHKIVLFSNFLHGESRPLFSSQKVPGSP